MIPSSDDYEATNAADADDGGPTHEGDAGTEDNTLYTNTDADAPIMDNVDDLPSSVDAVAAMHDNPPVISTPEPIQRDFEDLTLAEMIGQFWRAPFATFAAFKTVASRPARPAYRERYGGDFSGVAAAAATTSTPQPVALLIAMPVVVAVPAQPEQVQASDIRAAIRLLLIGLSVFFAFFGNTLYLQIAANGLMNQVSPLAGLPFFAVAAVLWICAEVIGSGSNENQAKAPLEKGWDEVFFFGLPQIALLVIGLALALMAYFLSSDNHFTLIGVFSWLVSIVFIAAYGLSSAGVSLSPSRWWREMREAIRVFNRDNRLTIVAVILITIGGAFFRLQQLNTMLPEMTSDHVEKLLDSQRVADGDFNVFFANNGGREPFQMYALAALAILPGINIDFMGLKLLAVIESVLTIPIFWLMGRAIIGDRDADSRRLGNWVGLAAAILLAGGYWHVAITRVALRIILTPLVVALVLIFLSRAMRHNRRVDFVLAGLALGFGVYTYQAVRMLPVVVVIGIGLAFLFSAHTRRQRVQMVYNLAVLVLVSFIVFVPMFRFSVERPQDFWRRTDGRLFGDDIITETLPDGSLAERTASLTERAEAFNANLPTLAGNVVRAIGMFNYRGDLAWFHNAPQYPAMDILTGALLVVGVAGWGVLIVRKRDMVYVLIPIALLVMLLPSALSIAIPEENPSHTRASGAMPTAYLLAAFGLASICYALWRFAPRRGGVMLAAVTLFGVGGLVYVGSAERLLGPYQQWYLASWHQPLSDAGDFLTGFAESDGSYGNAFMIAFPHWWDYRAVAIEAGLPPGKWPNGDIRLDQIPITLLDASYRDINSPYRLDINRDLLFLYSPEDSAAELQFQTWFPTGQIRLIDTYIHDIHFKVYRVPALGEEGFGKFLAANDITY